MLLILIALLVQAMTFDRHVDQIRARSLSCDCDGYWHLLRVQEIQRSGSWDNGVNPRGNAPFGERIHWTHAMDLVLWAGACIGSLFTDFNSSLYWWGVFVGPVFSMLSLLAIVLFGRTLVGPRYVMFLALVFLCSMPQLSVVYSANRPDHHCLVAFAYLLYYCLFTALVLRPGSAAVAVWAGVLGAFGLWCGLEVLVLLGLSAFFLGLLWLIRGREYLKANFLWALSVSVGLMITVLLDEKPSEYWTVAYDRRSIAHVALFLFLSLFWLAGILLRMVGIGNTVASRLAITAGVGGPGLLAHLSLFPEFVSGPMAKVNPSLYPLYLDRTTEFMGLSRSEPDVAFTVLLVLPVLTYLVWAAYRNQGDRRTMFAWLAVTLCAYSVMAMVTARWTFTLAMVNVLPTTLLLIALCRWERGKRHPLVVAAATLILLLAPYAAVLVYSFTTKAPVVARDRYGPKSVAMLSSMESQGYTVPGEIVLANIYIGPAIMYHTSMDAVGTANHNNDRGIVDTHRILNAKDDAAAYALVQERGIDYILVDDEMRKFAAIRIHSSSESKDSREDATFIGRLTLGQLPDWLVEMPVPDELSDTFTLYRVACHDVHSM